jgi:predicted Zn finger-like uncharacterized protein
MEISCDSCQSKFRIPEEKIHPQKGATFKCPKCQNRIEVSPAAIQSGSTPASDADELLANEFGVETYEADEKPFDFVEEEGKTALVCEQNPALKQSIVDVLRILEYHITEPENQREALKQMRYHDYNLIVIDENFDTRNPDVNGLLVYLERLHMAVRRNMIVCLVSNRYRTMDHMMAFQKSVNMIVNTKDINSFDQALRSGIADYEFSYRIFKETLK